MRGSQSSPTLAPYGNQSKCWGQSSLDKAIQSANAQTEEAHSQCSPGAPGSWTQDSIDDEIQRLNGVREAKEDEIARIEADIIGRTQNDIDAAILQLASASNKYTGSPQMYKGSPQQYNSSPHVYNGSPQQYNGSPQQYNGSPQQYNGSPQRYNGSPQTYNGSPQQYNRSPPRVMPSSLSPLRSPQSPIIGSPARSVQPQQTKAPDMTQEAIDAEIGRLCRIRMAEAAMNKDVMLDVTAIPPVHTIGTSAQPEVRPGVPNLVVPIRAAGVAAQAEDSLALQKSVSAPSVATQIAVLEERLAALAPVAPSVMAQSPARVTQTTSDAVDDRERCRRLREAMARQASDDRCDMRIPNPAKIFPATQPSPSTRNTVPRIAPAKLASPCAPNTVPRSRAVHFAGSPGQDAGPGVLQRRPPAQVSVNSQYSPKQPDKRPESPWATSSSAYGAHSSGASSSSTSNASPHVKPGRARLDAARLRTLALTSAVK